MQPNREEWTPQRRAQWEKTRSRGKSHFVWVRGMGVWGTLMIVASTLIQWLALAAMAWMNPVQPLLFLQIFLFNLFLCPIGGYLWGLLTWTTTEKSYNKAVGKTGS